jgi:hypothetical protein
MKIIAHLAPSHFALSSVAYHYRIMLVCNLVMKSSSLRSKDMFKKLFRTKCDVHLPRITAESGSSKPVKYQKSDAWRYL